MRRAVSTIANIPTGEFNVKRKFKTSQSQQSRNHVVRWWFVLRADENVLKRLEESWGAIAIQTNWKLEPLLSFAEEQPNPPRSQAQDESGEAGQSSQSPRQPMQGTNNDEETTTTQSSTPSNANSSPSLNNQTADTDPFLGVSPQQQES